tara:strand:+ start:439 stop:813 length:375 start_codon:yes stop_codon:yes gene_type:complete
MSKRVKIRKDQLKVLVEHLEGKTILKEDMKDVLMGTAALLGVKLSGFNDKLAKDALSSPKSLNLIKKYLEGERIDDIISGLEEMGMVNVKDKLESEAYDVQTKFNDIAFKIDGVTGGLAINVGE